MMGWSPRAINKFHENWPAGSGEEDFTIYGHGGHLGHVTRIMLTHFHFLVPESFHTKIISVSVKIRFLRKSGLNFCMYTTLGQGQVMTLTFNHHIPS